MRLNQILCEATFDLDAQVDYIWVNYFKDYAEALLNDKNPGDIDPVTIYSTELPASDIINKANSINPVSIIMHGTTHGFNNSYTPHDNEIHLSFNDDAIKFIFSRGGLSVAQQRLRNSGQHRQASIIAREFTPARVKGSIYHELSHWMDDTLHNSHIKKTIGNVMAAEPDKRRAILNQNHPAVSLTNFERDAQIHSIKQLKQDYADEWDTLSFSDMIELNPSLSTVYANAKDVGYGGSTYNEKWKKLIIKRMHREGLLGANMR